MLTGLECQACWFEVTVVRRRYANDVDTGCQKARDRLSASEIGEITTATGRRAPIKFSARAGATSDGYQLDTDGAEVAPVQRLGVKPLQQWPVRFFENHSHADHTGV
jgi:hypothetical protein